MAAGLAYALFVFSGTLAQVEQRVNCGDLLSVPYRCPHKVVVYLFEKEMKEMSYLLEKSLDENEAFLLDKYSD